jgi:hypothetical protein
MPLPQSSSRFRKLISILLLALGAAYWVVMFGPTSPGRLALDGMILAAVIAFVPSIGRWFESLVGWINAAIGPRRASVAITITILIAVYLFAFAYGSRSRLFLKLNDEHAYMIQARMLSHGRLWLAPYPPEIAPFFDALSMIVDRVYAPMYFPGTALAMVPFVWLRLPFWVMPVLSASVAAGLLYWVFAEMFDPVHGLLAVLMLASLHIYRDTAILLLADSPFLAAELVLLWAWLQFRRRPLPRYALAIGAAAGYAAITRPLDAVCFALPIGVAIVCQMRRQPRQLARHGLVIVLAASPCLALLIAQNRGVTGHWFELAESYYNRQNFPVSPLGFPRVDSNRIPLDLSAPKQQWLHDWVIPSFQRHTPANALRSWYRGRLWQTLDNALPNPILILLLPVALLSLGEARRRVLFAALVIFLVGYAVYLFFLEHYVISILPAMICMVLMGWESLHFTWPGRRLNIFLLISLLTISLAAIWPIAPFSPLPIPFAPDQRAANECLARLPKTPAVVLFRFDPMVGSFHDDPVYNDSVSWPNDAPIIRARDLGPEKDRDIFKYYAQRQPDRVFYVYDPDARAAGRYPITRLGFARQLAK